MASSSYVILSLLLISQLIVLVMAIPSTYCPTICERELKKELYLHGIHPPRPDRNLVVSVSSESESKGFGAVVVHNWAIRDAPAPNASLVANARGAGVNTDPLNGVLYQHYFSIIFVDSRFNGSTLQVMGLGNIGQWAIVGGTGELSFARGTITYKTFLSLPNEYYLTLNIHAFYSPPEVPGIA